MKVIDKKMKFKRWREVFCQVDFSGDIDEYLSVAEKYNLSGNLKQNIAAYLLVTDENTFSLSHERRGAEIGENSSIFDIAIGDYSELFLAFKADPCPDFRDYLPTKIERSSEDERIGKIIRFFAIELNRSESVERFASCIRRFYSEIGVGEFGLYKAFRVDHHRKVLPVYDFTDVNFQNLCDYDYQKSLLIANTEAFVSGKNANNVLLYGEAGTGKSTAVKAIVNEFFERGLRIVGVQRHQFDQLPSLISSLKKRNYKFIVFLDDLSFEEFETEYKYLKAVVEGGVDECGVNILFYATSNKRHLVKETFEEREGRGDIHRAETTSEKVSLSERFGLQIYYEKPNIDQYLSIVFFLAKQHGVRIPPEELAAEAKKWAIRGGGFSGRVAEQFIKSL